MFLFVNTLGAGLGDRERLLGIVSLILALGILYAASVHGVLRVQLDGTVPNETLNRVHDLRVIAYPMATVWFYRDLPTE